MEISLIKNIVITTKQTNTFELDFGKLVERIIKDWNSVSINELTEEDKEDIITAFDCNFDTILSEMLNIELYDMDYEEEDGYDIGDNAEMLEKIKNEFADYVYNL